jgi:hypothetical protein
MVLVRGVPMPVVDEVDVVVVRDRDVPAALPVCVIVHVVHGVAVGGALVPMVVVLPVQVPVVRVVDVAVVRHSDMTAAVPVGVRVSGMGGVLGAGHRRLLRL